MNKNIPLKLFAKILSLFIFLLYLSGCGDLPEGKALLKWNVKKGDTHKLAIYTENTATIRIKNHEEAVTQGLKLMYRFFVEDVSFNGDIRTNIRIEAVAARENSLLGEYVYNSENTEEETPPQLKRFGVLKGKSFTLTVSPTWEVKKVEGLDEIRRSLKQAEPTEYKLDDPNLGISLMDDVSEATILETLELVLAVFPGAEVNVGGSWNREVTTASQFPCRVRTLYTLEKVEGGEALLTLQKTISPNLENPNVFTAGFKAEVSGRGQGFIRLDGATGFPLQGQITELVQGNFEAPLLSVVSKSNTKGFPISMQNKIMFLCPDYTPKNSGITETVY